MSTFFRSAQEDLDEKYAQYNKQITDLEEERTTLHSQIAETEISATRMDAIKDFCDLRSEGLDYFDFEDRRGTIELLDVTAVILRGETQADDRILLQGYFPDVIIDPSVKIADQTYLCLVRLVLAKR